MLIRRAHECGARSSRSVAVNRVRPISRSNTVVCTGIESSPVVTGLDLSRARGAPYWMDSRQGNVLADAALGSVYSLRFIAPGYQHEDIGTDHPALDGHWHGSTDPLESSRGM